MTELSGAMPGLASEGGAMPIPGNLFAGPSRKAAAEAVETLVSSPAVRIERIVSTGQASPPGFWYDEPLDEWVVVLSGAAGLLVAGEDGSGRSGPATTSTCRPTAAIGSNGPMPPSRRSGSPCTLELESLRCSGERRGSVFLVLIIMGAIFRGKLSWKRRLPPAATRTRVCCLSSPS